jgi:hypothetical protein
MGAGKPDAEKARYWQQRLGEAARSGISIREYCRRRPAEGEPVLLVAASAALGPDGKDRDLGPPRMGKRRASRW